MEPEWSVHKYFILDVILPLSSVNELWLNIFDAL